jgi:hypothetical protein
MTAVDDFGVRHLIAIDSIDVNFRLNYELPKKNHYYIRMDYETPAQIINTNKEEKDIIVEIGIHPAEYYLEHLDYSYVSPDSYELLNIMACSGKKHLWTNAELIYNEEILFNLLENSSVPVWIINYSNQKTFYANEVQNKINSTYKDYLVGTSLDGLINVYRVKSGRN